MFDDLIIDKEKKVKERMKERMKILKKDEDEDEDEEGLLDQYGYIEDKNNNNNTNI